jgi:hypothetical protein
VNRIADTTSLLTVSTEARKSLIRAPTSNPARQRSVHCVVKRPAIVFRRLRLTLASALLNAKRLISEFAIKIIAARQYF